MGLGNRVRNLRLSNDLSCQDLADITGLSKSMISLIENEKKNPSRDTIVKIAKGLNTTPEFILTGEKKYIITQFMDQLVEQGLVSGDGKLSDELRENIIAIVESELSILSKIKNK